MLTDLQICDYLKAQYDRTPGVFDLSGSIDGVDYALKRLPEETLVAFEGSHDIPDWISNFQALMRKSRYGGYVEEGFETGIVETVNILAPQIPLDKRVICAGHSRGAAHAHIFARGLILKGFLPRMVDRVVFGSPRVGDAKFCKGLKDSMVTSYRNYGGILDQDTVCTVPAYIPFIAPYKHPGPYKLIDVEGNVIDPWFLLKRHHLALYRQGIELLQR